MKEKIKDIIVRAVKTFIQGSLAVLVVNINNFDGTTAITSLFIGVLAGGISAVMNLIINLCNEGGGEE